MSFGETVEYMLRYGLAKAVLHEEICEVTREDYRVERSRPDIECGTWAKIWRRIPQWVFGEFSLWLKSLLVVTFILYWYHCYFIFKLLLHSQTQRPETWRKYFLHTRYACLIKSFSRHGVLRRNVTFRDFRIPFITAKLRDVGTYKFCWRVSNSSLTGSQKFHVLRFIILVHLYKSKSLSVCPGKRFMLSNFLFLTFWLQNLVRLCNRVE